MDYLEIARKAKANFQKDRQAQPETAKPIDEGRVIAYLIASEVLGCDIWFALDDGWKSGDDTPVFYASEIPHLQKMSGEELRKRYEQKLALSGGWIRDKIEERTPPS
jgi:hypothetical protein